MTSAPCTIRVGIHSDFHIESPTHGPSFRFTPPDCDILVVPGDIAPPCSRLLKDGFHGSLRWLRSQVGPDLPVVFVAGNADYSHFPYEQVIQALAREAEEQNIHFLHNQSVDLFGIQFLGTSLFSSAQLPGLDSGELLLGVSGKLKTFNMSRLESDICTCGATPICAAPTWSNGVKGPDGQILGVDWYKAQHTLSREFLSSHLSSPSNKPRFVISHWAPSLRSIPSGEYPLSPKHAYWASDNEDLVGNANVWVHGHIHQGSHYRVGNNPNTGLVISNSHGLPVLMFRNTDYCSQGVLELSWHNQAPDSDLTVTCKWSGAPMDIG